MVTTTHNDNVLKISLMRNMTYTHSINLHVNSTVRHVHLLETPQQPINYKNVKFQAILLEDVL